MGTLLEKRTRSEKKKNSRQLSNRVDIQVGIEVSIQYLSVQIAIKLGNIRNVYAWKLDLVQNNFQPDSI